MKTAYKTAYPAGLAGDICHHGRNAQGYHLFTCYTRGLGRYMVGGCRTLADAKRAALDYFAEQAKKAA